MVILPRALIKDQNQDQQDDQQQPTPPPPPPPPPQDQQQEEDEEEQEEEEEQDEEDDKPDDEVSLAFCLQWLSLFVVHVFLGCTLPFSNYYRNKLSLQLLPSYCRGGHTQGNLSSICHPLSPQNMDLSESKSGQTGGAARICEGFLCQTSNCYTSCQDRTNDRFLKDLFRLADATPLARAVVC